MSTYNTRQRSTVEGFFRDHGDRGFTPEETAAALSSVPRSTVYRLIAQLADEGMLRRTATDGRKAVYQYQEKGCSSHMHIRCLGCGRTMHLDEPTTRAIEEIVSSATGFDVLDTTVFEGVCRECRECGR